MKNQANVLFIVIDQLRADCIFGALAQQIKIPNLTALMEDAVTFKSHYSVANPCGPSRASLLTGQYAMNHRSVRNGTPLAAGTDNIATQMRQLSYEPMLFGYTDTSLDPRALHANDPAIRTYEQVLPGFVEKLEMRQEESYPWRSHIARQGYPTRDYATFYHPQTPSGASPRIDDPAFYKAQDSDSAFLTQQTLNELSVRQQQNWFAHVTYIRPPPPLVAPAPYNSMYRNSDLPDPLRRANRSDEAQCHPFLATHLEVIKDKSVVDGPFANCDKDDLETARSLRSVYLGLVSEVDQQVGRLVDFLKSTGQYDSTLIVLTADHAEMLGDHHMWGKQTIYDSAVHVPLIIRDPRQQQTHGSTVNAFTESVDIMPTILQWADSSFAIPSSVDGHSLAAFLQGHTPENWREHIFYELDFAEPGAPTLWQQQLDLSLEQANVAVLRDRQYKLVHFNGNLPALLFDIQADPAEMCNLATDPSYQTVLLQMSQKMLNHRMSNANSSLSEMRVTASGTVNYRNG
ncbi:MAG: sulfatase family protein [Osedax symbiont Rs2]|nr:MAG: sulfatase family protein [Osedax symbiont Rs2]